MNKFLIVLSLIGSLALTSCSTDAEDPVMQYQDHIIAGLEPKGNKLERVNFTRIGSFGKLGVGFDDTYPVDLDGDGIDDLILVREEVGDSMSHITLEIFVLPQEGVEIVVNEVSTQLVQPLDLMDRIDANKLWTEGDRFTIFNSYRTEDGFDEEGLWEEQSNKSIGVKIRKEDADLYGWVWINIASKDWGNASWILEYASTIGYQQ